MLDCAGCLKHEKDGLSKFLIKKKNIKAKKKAQQLGIIPTSHLSDITNQVLNNLDEEFNEKYNSSFTTQIKKKFNLENKKTSAHTKIIATKVGKAVIENTKEQWNETVVER